MKVIEVTGPTPGTVANRLIELVYLISDVIILSIRECTSTQLKLELDSYLSVMKSVC